MKLHPFTAPLARPFRSSLGTFSERKGVLVSLVVDGHTGWGEASPLPGLSTESLDAVIEELTQLCAKEVSPPTTIEAVGSWSERYCTTASAQHAVASAILDAIGKASNTPVASLLSKTIRDQIPISYLYSGQDNMLISAVEAGAQVVKVKVGIETVDADVRKIRHIRGLVSPDVTIRVDANGAWTEEQALRAIEQMEPLGVRSMEEPVGHGNLEAMARLRRRGIQIALDESVRSLRDLERIIALDAADAIVLKPMLIGTPMRTMEMMERADKAGLHLWITTTIDGAVGRMMAIQLAAAAPTENLAPCGLNTASWLREDIGETPTMSGGAFNSPKGSGLGVEVKH